MGNRANNLYYTLKPIIPRRLQIYLRRKIVSRKRLLYRETWPIDEKAGKRPEGWSGWPGGKRFALVLSHDVETAKGHDNCRNLMELEEKLGLHSSFNFVPERYKVSAELRRHLTDKGFEVGVHGLCHDGKLYRSKKKFQSRALKINHYLKEWQSVGFHSPSMQNNLEWAHYLNIEYDSSTFDTDPFEPCSDAVGTIFPFMIEDTSAGSSYVEIPYTLPQDSTLFIIMREKNIKIWKEKLDWVAKRGGMVLISTHPDYMNFNGASLDTEEYPSKLYKELLDYIKERYEGQYWHALPKEMAQYWKSSSASIKPARADFIKKTQKKVLMLLENHIPGDVRPTNEAAALLKAGYKVAIIALRNKGERSRAIVDGVQVYRIPTVTLFGKVCRPDASHLQKLFYRFKSAFGYFYEHLYFTTACLLVSFYIFIKDDFDIIHAHNPPDTLFIVGWFYKLLGKKFIFDHHDLSPELFLTKFPGKKGLVYKTLVLCEKLSCRLADAVICTNESYKKIQMDRHHIDSNRIFIVRNDPVIDDCLLTNIDNTAQKNGKKVLLFLGSINPQDGVDVLLQTIHYLINTMNVRDFVCYIVGDGDSLSSMMRFAEELNITEYVDFKGYVYDREKVKKFLYDSDVCVESAPLNELNRHSTFIKIMEYMAAAKPIVAFDLKETRYSANGTAILIPPGDIKSFASAIKKLMDEPQLRTKLGKSGQERIRGELRWEKASLNLVEAYKSVYS